MKIHGRALALTAVLGTQAAFAAPFMAVGDNAELFLTAGVEIQHDDNIFLDNTTEKSDTIFVLSPGLDLVFGNNAATSGHLSYREDFYEYSDYNNQSTSVSDVDFASAYTNGKTKVNLSAGYVQKFLSDNNINAAGVNIRREISNAGIDGEFGVSEKTTLGVGASYQQTDYSTAGYIDVDSWTLPLDVYYEYSPKLAVSLGYRYSNTNSSTGGVDASDHFFNIGARGEFTPKLAGQVRVGYVLRDFKTGGTTDDFGLDADLAYAVSAKTRLQVNASNSFSNSSTGQSTKRFVLGTSVQTLVSEQLSVGVGLAYNKIDYPTRTDDFFQGSLRAVYTYNSYLKYEAGYVYRNNTSDIAGAEFSNNLFTVGVKIRY